MSQFFETITKSTLEKIFPNNHAEVFDSNGIANDAFLAKHLDKLSDLSYEVGNYICKYGLIESAKVYVQRCTDSEFSLFLYHIEKSDYFLTLGAEVVKFDSTFFKMIQSITILSIDFKKYAQIEGFDSGLSNAIQISSGDLKDTTKLESMAIELLKSGLVESLKSIDRTFPSFEFSKNSYVPIKFQCGNCLYYALKWKAVTQISFSNYFLDFYDSALVEKILEEGLVKKFTLTQDYSTSDYNGQFLLYAAAKAGDFKTVKMLLIKGASAVSDYIYSIEHYLAKPENYDFVKDNAALLLTKGFSLSRLLEIYSNGSNLSDKNNVKDNFLLSLIKNPELSDYFKAKKEEIVSLIFKNELAQSMKALDEVSYLINLEISSNLSHKLFNYLVYKKYSFLKALFEKGAKFSDHIEYYHLLDHCEFLKEVSEFLVPSGIKIDENEILFLKLKLINTQYVIEKNVKFDALKTSYAVKHLSYEDIVSLAKAELIDANSLAYELFNQKQFSSIVKLLEENIELIDSPNLKEHVFETTSIEVTQAIINHEVFDKFSRMEKLSFLLGKISAVSQLTDLESREFANAVIKPLLQKEEFANSNVIKAFIFSEGNVEFLKLAMELGYNFNTPILLEGKFSPMQNSAPASFYPVHLAAMSEQENYLDRLKFMEANGADIAVLDERGLSTLTYFLQTLSSPEDKPVANLVTYANNRSSKVLDYFLFEKGIAATALDYLLLSSLPTEIETSKYAKELFNNISLSEKIYLPNDFEFDQENIPQLIKFQYSEYIYASHFFAVQADAEELNRTLQEFNVDPNAKDSLGKTALFYAQSKEVASILISAGADLDIIDNNGNGILHSVTDIDTLSYLIENGAKTTVINHSEQRWFDNKDISELVEKGLIKDWQSIPDLLNKELQKGNILQVTKLIKSGGHLNNQLKKDLVESIKMGTLASKEVNKFQALIASSKKMGVKLPSFLEKYANDPKDYYTFSEMEMILNNEFLNAMVDKYLENFSFNDHGLCYDQSILYTQTFNQVVSRIESDIAQEVLIINDLATLPVETEFFVYRGLRIIDATGFIEHNKMFGHKPLIKDKPQNFVFHAEEDWNNTPHESYAWEFPGVYMSYSRKLAEDFAQNNFHTSTLNTGNGILLTIKITPDILLTCGNVLKGFEVVSLTTIPTEAIKSFTLVDTGEIIANPHYIESALDSKPALTEEKMLANYKASGCEDYVNSKEEELPDYETFESNFKPENLIAHRAEVYAKEVCPA